MKLNPADLDHRSAHHLMVGIIVPRPIAWVSTISEEGVFNLAPFSCLMSISLHPNLICISIGSHRDGQKKDTIRNIEFSQDFVINTVNEDLADTMNQTSAYYPISVSEFDEVGLTPINSDIVKSPRLAESPVNMECRLKQILEFGEASTGSHVIIGEILLVHVREELWTGIDIDLSKLKPIGRLGAQLYCRTTDFFEMKRPEANV